MPLVVRNRDTDCPESNTPDVDITICCIIVLTDSTLLPIIRLRSIVFQVIQKTSGFWIENCTAELSQGSVFQFYILNF